MAVRVSGLVVRRGGREILRGIDCAVPEGSVTGLLGPSGCGKTTLLRSVMGLQRLTDGTVTVLGRPAGHRSLRRSIGYCPQTPSVYLDLTVLENIRYFASVIGASPADADRVLDTLRLSDHRHQIVASLSGGQRSRASLAVALLGEPKLLVLDEPTVGLDPVLRLELWDAFAEIAARGTALLVSSHVMDEAARCHELLLMRDGVLLAQESPDSLRARTGTQDLEQAFLSVIREHEARNPPAGHTTEQIAS
ncbi:ABC transporter ATP-binding protein [Streptomyces sp. NPDC050803]|uniref:ABC transporter ATP-binding protein n=1 Tax=unclassified Streptomyces TaxID=2593676 RepID=UPI003434474C